MTSGADAKPVAGRLSFIDNAVDAQAGTIRVKGEFSNNNTSLWPGQYVTARVVVQTLKDALVIPQTAIITSTNGTFVAGQRVTGGPVGLALGTPIKVGATTFELRA